MKRRLLTYLLIALSLFNICRGLTPPLKFEYVFLDVSRHPLFNKKESGPETIIKSRSLDLRIQPAKQEQSLLFKIINWDCKLKIKLNRNFNIIVCYN
ncbi:MAG: hypothetical protein ABIP40_13930 [Bacteroidia bacterium]